MTRILLLIATLPLAACAGGVGGNGGLFGRGPVETVSVDPPPGETAEVDPAAEDLPELTSGEGTVTGFTVVSFDATVSGLRIVTPLIDVEGPGRVVAENGQQIRVTLVPSGGERGSGSRMSLEAFQALGLSLTALPTVTVISDA